MTLKVKRNDGIIVDVEIAKKNVYITTEDLKNICVSAWPLPDYSGEGGVRKTDIPLLELFKDLSISSIELSPYEDGYIHYSRKENEWWIKRKNKQREQRDYREYINLYFNNERLHKIIK